MLMPKDSPIKEDLARKAKEAPSLLLESTFAVEDADLAEVEGLVDISFGDVVTSDNLEKAGIKVTGMEKGSPTKARIILQGKENIIPI